MSTNGIDFGSLIEQAGIAAACYDRHCRCRYVSPAMERLLGPADVLLGRLPVEAFPGQAWAVDFQFRLQAVLDSGVGTGFEAVVGGASDEPQSFCLFPETTTANAADAGVIGVFAMARDLSARRAAEFTRQRLTRALRLLSICNQTLLHAVDEQGLLDDICRLIVETGGYRMAWVGFAEEGPGQPVRPVSMAGAGGNYLTQITISWGDNEFGHGPTGRSIREGAVVINRDFLSNAAVTPWRAAATAHGYRSSVSLPLLDGGRAFGALTIYSAAADAFYDEEVKLLEELANDLAFGLNTLRSRRRREQAEERLAFLANHDPLTELPNRLLLRDRFDAAARRADEDGVGAALLFIDLDYFKHVNDSLGHEIGDRLLQVVAERLKRCVGPGDTISRQGGDEFVILLAGVADPAVVAAVAERVLQRVAEPMQIAGNLVATSLSIGVTLFPADGRDFETLLKRADTALYHAKEHGRAACSFFSADMSVESEARWRLYASLRRAIEHQEFLLHYQPQVEICSGRVVGVEALIRWRPPGQDQLTPPGVFIPAAEQSGLIVPIGEWVLNEACAQAAAWRRDGVANITMAVNLSAIQFRRGAVVETVTRALTNSGLPPHCLDLELTESLLLDDTEAVRRTIGVLKDMGVQFSIDDFGAGYSSLSYLKRLAVNKLKIDQSFIRDLTGGDDDAVVKAIIQMGRTLQLTVVAEGVETADQLAFLAAQGCCQMQGYLFSRPLPADDVAEILHRPPRPLA